MKCDNAKPLNILLINERLVFKLTFNGSSNVDFLHR